MDKNKNKDKCGWQVFNHDFSSLYPNVMNLYDAEDLIREVNKRRLKEQRIEKLKKINNL